MTFRRFRLSRVTDVSGTSGTGVVAEGVEFSDGTAVMRWVTDAPHSTVMWADTDSLIGVHGHNGATTIEWIDT